MAKHFNASLLAGGVYICQTKSSQSYGNEIPPEACMHRTDLSKTIN